jgi:CDP-paratose 2-epimerase
MNLLVAGGCGFVGAAIIRRFMQHRIGWKYTVIDSLRRVGSERNAEDLESRGVEVIRGDVRQMGDIEAAGDDFAWVIDAAAEPSVTLGGLTPSQAVGHNLIGSMNLIENAAAIRAGFVLLSTSRVYSINALRMLRLWEEDGRFVLAPNSPESGVTYRGIDESFSTAAPVSVYGATKLAAETMALEYAHHMKLPCIIDRCGVITGEGQFGRGDQGVFSWWIKRWKDGAPLWYKGWGGRGHQTRCVLHPDDLADLLLYQIDARPIEVMNISGGIDNAVSLETWSRWCEEAMGPRVVGSVELATAGDVPWLVLNSDAARNAYFWRPAISAQEIFERTLRNTA